MFCGAILSPMTPSVREACIDCLATAEGIDQLHVLCVVGIDVDDSCGKFSGLVISWAAFVPL